MNTETTPSILIVEDDPHSRILLEKILSKEKFQVHSCPSGVEALNLLSQGKEVDLVISDWVMPGLDGVELCSRIKAIEKLRLTYFILLTSKELTEDKVAALNAGVDDYLTKPCHQGELLARVRAALRIINLQREILTLERRMGILRLAVTAGHEINNPLTGVFGYLDLLREGVQSESDPKILLDYIDKLHSQAKRIRDIVARLIHLKEIHIKPYLGNQQMIDLSEEIQDTKKE